jgi:small-conductance mechanosensitive channel
MFDLLTDLHFITLILQILIVLTAAFVLVRLFRRLLKATEERTKIKKGILFNVQRFIQIVIYSIAIILILWMLNIDITGLVASLGIGALIIGFALKEIIENWVSGLLIVSGKAYRIGDVISVGNLRGVVVDISLRTTKLKTYDRNEVVIPNSMLLKDKIINLTGGKQESVASITFLIDYVFNVDKAKQVIESVLMNHHKVIVDHKKRREIRFIVRTREWSTEIEPLFWINDPANEEFIKSEITELVKMEFQRKDILPPIPGFMRREFLEAKK